MNIDINVVPEEDTVIPMELDMDVVNYTGVQSVNGMSGDVVLTANDVGALPQDYTPPVASVNRKTGDVVLRYSDVGALPDTTVIPTKTSQLRNDSGFITSVPVQTVNGKTGNVVLNASDVGAIPDTLLNIFLIQDSTSGNPANVPDSAGFPVIDLSANIEPIQTGTGDPSPSNIRPIIAANGKNILPLTVASCQTNSTAGTWNGNAYTHLGVTYTLNTGADGTVESVTMNGTSTGASELLIALVSFDPTKTYKVNGITGATSSTYRFNIGGVGTYYDNDYTVTFEGTSEHICRLQVPNGVAVSNATVQPMIRLDGTDATFQPYQGITVERTGKNLFNIDNMVNATNIVVDKDAETITVTNNSINSTKKLSELATLTVGSSYILTAETTSTERLVYLYGSNSSWAFGTTRTITQADLNSTVFFYGGTGVTSVISKFMIRLSSITDSSYEPYVSPVSYPISLGRAVYGGTVDLATGVLTVTHGIDLIDGNHAMSANGLDADASRFILTPNPAKAYGKSGFISDKFYIGTGIYVGKMVGRANNEKIEFYLPVDVPQTVTGGQAWFADNPTTVCYPLATPTTVQLTPIQVDTLFGTNNFISNGTVSVTYYADTKLYIDKKTQ